MDKDTELTIVDILDARMRPYDMVSVLHPGEVTALLPETNAEGGQKLALALHQLLEEQGVQCEFTVHAYPEDGSIDSEDPPEGESRAVATDPWVRATSLETAFLQPQGFLKRAMDVAWSGAALLLLSPVLIAAALAVKLTSPGPIIYTQKRAGVGGRPFTFFKFRSMYVDADARLAELKEQNEQEGPIFKMRNDPRMTPIGRFLRRTSIDELPQLWNVFRGDMTLIGPRPPKVEEVEGYEPWQRRRLAAKGGLTCIWQVSGRSEIGFIDWVRMDLRYIDRRSLMLDLRVLSKTFWAVASGRGAY